MRPYNPTSGIHSKINFKAKLGADYSGLDGTSSFIYITHMWIIGQAREPVF